MPADPTTDRAAALLDAHVAFELERLTGPALAATVVGLVDDVLDALAGHEVADLVDAAAVGRAVAELVATVPGSPLAAAVAEVAAEVVHEGPERARSLAELVDREHVEEVFDHLLALVPVLERVLDQLTASPLAGTVAARFMGRVVSEVVATNQEIANKVPGLGSLVSFGTSAANRVRGAADKPLEALLAGGMGGSVGRGGAYAVGRLNRVVVDTLRDPATRGAVLQAWDLVAAEEYAGLAEFVTLDQATGLAGAVHDLVASVLAHEDTEALIGAVAATCLDRFGGYTVVELLEQLDVDRHLLAARAVEWAPGVVTALHESGDLERLVRARLAPFYASEAARRLLTPDPAPE